jgi:hypothetical protein
MAYVLSQFDNISKKAIYDPSDGKAQAVNPYTPYDQCCFLEPLGDTEDGWSDIETYSKGETVIYDNKIYESREDDNLNHLPTDTEWWAYIRDASDGQWSGEVTYSEGEKAEYSRKTYQSRQSNNLNHLPTDTDWWLLIASNVSCNNPLWDSIPPYGGPGKSPKHYILQLSGIHPVSVGSDSEPISYGWDPSLSNINGSHLLEAKLSFPVGWSYYGTPGYAFYRKEVKEWYYAEGEGWCLIDVYIDLGLHCRHKFERSDGACSCCGFIVVWAPDWGGGDQYSEDTLFLGTFDGCLLSGSVNNLFSSGMWCGTPGYSYIHINGNSCNTWCGVWLEPLTSCPTWNSLVKYKGGQWVKIYIDSDPRRAGWYIFCSLYDNNINNDPASGGHWGRISSVQSGPGDAYQYPYRGYLQGYGGSAIWAPE